MSNDDSFLPEQPRRTLQDLVVPPRVQQQIEAAMARLHSHETLYREWGLETVDLSGSAVALKLCGPPGTGGILMVEPAHD